MAIRLATPTTPSKPQPGNPQPGPSPVAPGLQDVGGEPSQPSIPAPCPPPKDVFVALETAIREQLNRDVAEYKRKLLSVNSPVQAQTETSSRGSGCHHHEPRGEE